MSITSQNKKLYGLPDHLMCFISGPVEIVVVYNCPFTCHLCTFLCTDFTIEKTFNT